MISFVPSQAWRLVRVVSIGARPGRPGESKLVSEIVCPRCKHPVADSDDKVSIEISEGEARIRCAWCGATLGVRDGKISATGREDERKRVAVPGWLVIVLVGGQILLIMILFVLALLGIIRV